MPKTRVRDRSKDALPPPSGEVVILRDVPLPEPPKHGDQWGRWRYDGQAITLDDSEGYYWIDLDRTSDAAGILDWIAQLNDKSWLSAKDIGDLVQAFDDLVGFGLQASVCGCAYNKPFALGDHLRSLRDG